MMKLPCPRCGSVETYGTFCKDCLRTLYPLVASIQEGAITLCVACDRVKIENTWRPILLDDAVPKALAKSLSFASNTKIDSVEFAEAPIERKEGTRKTVNVLAVVTGRHSEANQEYEEEYDVPLKYFVTRCPHCIREGTSYYEGILQVRNESSQIKASIRSYLKEHRSKGLHLSKEIPTSRGTDYYLSDHRAVGHIARKLHAQYGGEMKINAKHFSEDTRAGKILYRTNAYLEIPEYGKGDVIFRDDRYYYILGIAIKVTAEDLLSGRNETFLYRKGESTRLPIRTTRVTRLDPVEVLHPVTFQSVQPQSSKFAPAELKIDRKASVAYDGDHLFLIPDAQEFDATPRARRRQSQKVSSMSKR